MTAAAAPAAPTGMAIGLAGGAQDIRLSDDDLVEIDPITLVDEDRTVAPVFRTLEPQRVHEFETRQAARRHPAQQGNPTTCPMPTRNTGAR